MFALIAVNTYNYDTNSTTNIHKHITTESDIQKSPKLQICKTNKTWYLCQRSYVEHAKNRSSIPIVKNNLHRRTVHPPPHVHFK